jgi:hypothetical protein
VGTWLAEWVSRNVTDVLGVDGDNVDRPAMQIQSGNFRPTDLRSPFWLGRRFSLVESLEVAQDLAESCVDDFVKSLARHADTVLFSAAIPGQGGAHHVNEQWPSYWVTKFSHVGLMLFDVIRPNIWADRRVDWWYRQNILLFSKGPAFDVHDTCIDLVHPEYWEARHPAAADHSRGSTGSDSSASTAKTASCTRQNGSFSTALSSASSPSAYSRWASDRL